MMQRARRESAPRALRRPGNRRSRPDGGPAAAFAQGIVGGAKDFTEQLLVAEMTVRLLQAAGLAVYRGTGFTTSGIRTFQESGIVDVYWEYTGTSLTTFNQVTEKLSPEDAYARVKALDARRSLVWLAPSRVNNSYALTMRRADAETKGIGSISDLAAKVRAGERIRFASNLEFLHRPDGLKPLEAAYGFAFPLGSIVSMENAAVYGALRGPGEFDVGVVFATDGRIAAFGLATPRGRSRPFPELHPRAGRARDDARAPPGDQADPGEAVR